jgi:hypothetical protein
MAPRRGDLMDSKATVVGDVIASRTVRNQQGLLSSLGDALDAVNSEVAPSQPLQVTIGDEFQGAYETIEEALRATLLVLLHTKVFRRVRLGIGWGSISVSDRSVLPMSQSGPGWWNAREAIEELKKEEKMNNLPKTVRTRFKSDDLAQMTLVNAYLASRDHIVSRMDSMDTKITLLLREGRSQVDISRMIETSQSNISRRAKNNGPMTMVWTLQSLERLDR